MRESVLLLTLLLFGVVLLPVGIYFVGKAVFGAYGGDGYVEFLGSILRKLLTGDWVAWFLVLSPYFAVQTVRLTLAGWRASSRL